MQLNLNVLDINGVRLVSALKVQVQVYAVTGATQTPQAEVWSRPRDIGAAELGFDIADATKVRIVVTGVGYPKVDFSITPNSTGGWGIDIAGINDADKETKRLLSKAYVRFKVAIGDRETITEVTVVMPRLWLAPIGPDRFTGAPGAKPGTFIKRHDGVVGFRGRYFDLSLLEDLNFHLVDAEMLKPPANPKAAGWERLKTTMAAIKPPGDLWFRLVEYGGDGGGPRFLVALCGPLKGLVGEDASLDAILYYAPATIVQDAKHTYNLFPPSRYPFRDDYPYAEIVLEEKESWNQPYCSMAFAYLMVDGLRGGYRLAYQLLAAKKAAVIIMPISPYGNLGPFLTRAGAWRLVREASYFAYGMREQNDAPQEPRTNRLAICGYSAGVEFANKLLTGDKDTLQDDKGQGYDRFVWGSKADDLGKAWKETWVLDATGGLSGLAGVKSRLANWVKGADDRCLRIYQTQFTVGPTWSPASDLQLKDDFAALFGANPVINTVKNEKDERLAEEAHSADGRFSALYFSNAFLNFAAATDSKIVDSHHTIPSFAFGHAARTSRLRPLP